MEAADLDADRDDALSARTLACTTAGVFLWPGSPLLTKLGGQFVVRPRDRVYDLVCRLHGPRAAWTPLLPALERAAQLLNAGDVTAAQARLDRLVLPPLSRAGADLMRAIARRFDLEPLALPVAPDDQAGLAPDLAAGLADAYYAIEGDIWPLRKASAAADFDDRHPRLGVPPNPGWFATTAAGEAKAAPPGAAASSRLALLDRYLKSPNVRAFLDTIAEAEGGKYNNLYGGKTFDSYARFPGAAGHSPAGRYQITRATYDGLSQRLGLTDFSPATQDYMAVQRLVDRGAMAPLLAGDMDGAITAAAPEWNALPQGPGKANRMAGQPYVRYERIKQIYERHRRAYRSE
ncbi:hypothetical protein GCM10011611_23140 [Aliidongia dinghuensis]|uniref:Uncharacterized protein n=2 Tax=Aliidongia dinghuensis TaxID=1867774 RepID=A0A8J2YTQ4_9PROT|nr:hypothetical protein GCM10011611_23140 [Aliidongia dinghuensis]